MGKQKRGGVCSNIAILSTDLSQHTKEEGWRMLMPAGYFKANDGRPAEPKLSKGWYMNKRAADRLIAALKSRGQDVVGDYEHATLKSRSTGNPAPAAAWLSSDEIKWIEGKGLFIRPRWTEKASAMLESKEYRFLSPVFIYDQNTGEPTYLHSFSLTNDPAIPDMDELVALASELITHDETKTDKKETPAMDEHLKTLLELLQVEVIDDNYDEAIDKAKEIIAALQTKEKEVEQKEEQIAELTSNKIDLSLYVPKQVYDEAQKQIVALSSAAGGLSIDSMIKNARAEGRIAAYEESYLRSFGEQQGIAALSSMIKARKPIVALESTQVTQEILDAAEEAVEDELTPEQLAIMEEMGITKEEYLQYLLEQKEKEEKGVQA